MISRRLLFCARSTAPLIACCVFLAGCGGRLGDVPELTPVKGKILLNDQPLGDAQVQFAPTEKGAASSAVTAADGTFKLAYRDGTPGAVPGTHNVSVTWGGPTPEQQAALEAAAEGNGVPPTNIPSRQTYTETLNVQPGENDITLRVVPSSGARGRPLNSAER